MRTSSCWLLLLLAIFTTPALGADKIPSAQSQPVDLEFGGYHFGQSPAANMVCYAGFCKSQAPGGDGRVTVPFSVYETPDAVSPLAGLTIIRSSYCFWEDRLFRVFFQVDCTPLDTGECLDDIAKSLDREYGLTPLSVDDTHDFTTGKRVISREFATDSGAFVKVMATISEDVQNMPTIDIVDRGMANLVGSTLSPTFRPKRLDLPNMRKNP